jgi:hypothetical protein
MSRKNTTITISTKIQCFRYLSTPVMPMIDGGHRKRKGSDTLNENHVMLVQALIFP